MGFALTPGEAPLHFSRSKNVMHVVDRITVENGFMMEALASARYDEANERTVA